MASSANELRLIVRYFGASMTRAASVASGATKTGTVGSALLAGAETLDLGLHSAVKPLIKQMQVANMFESATVTRAKPTSVIAKAVQTATRTTAQL